MQAVAAHSHPDGWLQAADQFELQRRRRCGSGARPVDGNAAGGGGASQHLADRMNAERERQVRAPAAAAAGAVVDARKSGHRRDNVVVAARIEQRCTGRTAGPPEFGDAVVGCQAERFVKLPIVELAQRLLVQDRNFAPFVRIVEPIRIDVIELAFEERRAASLRDRTLFALGLQCARSRAASSADRRAASCVRRVTAPRQGADPAALLGISIRQAAGVFGSVHCGGAGVLGWRIFRNCLERVAQHGRIVGADRAHVGAAPAAGDDAGAAQNALPEIETVLASGPSPSAARRPARR